MAVDEDPIYRCVYLTQALGSHRIREVTMFEFQPSTAIEGQCLDESTLTPVNDNVSHEASLWVNAKIAERGTYMLEGRHNAHCI